MKIRGAVLIAILGLMLSITPSAFAGGSGPSVKDGDNPHETGCDAGAIDVPESSRPISIDNVPYGEFVVRASTVCPSFRWAEVRYYASKGYEVTVSMRGILPDFQEDTYTVFDTKAETPVFTDMYQQSGACIMYGARVLNPEDETHAVVAEGICEVSGETVFLQTPVDPPISYLPLPEVHAEGTPPQPQGQPVPVQPVTRPIKKVVKKKARCKLVRRTVKHPKAVWFVRVCPKAKKKTSHSKKHRPYGITIGSGSSR